jgi:hypothetical protein
MSNVHETCRAIQAAQTPIEVLSAVNAYLESLPDDAISRLRPAMIASGLEHARQLAAVASELVLLEASSVASAEELAPLHEAATVFSTAAMRAAVLCFAEAD